MYKIVCGVMMLAFMGHLGLRVYRILTGDPQPLFSAISIPIDVFFIAFYLDKVVRLMRDAQQGNDARQPETCPACHGGKVVGNIDDIHVCKTCKGSGHV